MANRSYSRSCHIIQALKRLAQLSAKAKHNKSLDASGGRVFCGKRTPFDVIKEIRVPVQGPYGTKDTNALLADARRFEKELRVQNTPVEFLLMRRDMAFSLTTAVMLLQTL